MDFHIPLPDELEWLESHTHFSEDEFEILPPDEPNDVVSEPPPQSQSNAHKRLRSESPETVVQLELSGEKRSKVDDDVADNEEWLKYSPPREEVVVEEVREKIVSRYVSEIDGEFVPVTAPVGGDRVYAKFCRTEREERGDKLNVRPQSKGLIVESVDVLLRRLEQEAFTKALQTSSESQSEVEALETPKVHEQLWVDKYAPSSFTELLSDEHTNREVLLWLKQWDSVVFGSEIRSTSEEVFSALRRHSSISQHKLSDSTIPWKNKGRWRPGNFRHVNSANNKNSNSRGIQEMWNKKPRHSGPPEQKILLLCGPPGLGKTTLAHVAAKHCGYRVVEVNASDDRSSSTIEAKILDVIQMDSVMADSRPKCLVIDEIDGSLGDGRGAVEVILKMVAAEKKVDAATETAGKGEQSKRASSKKGRKAATLLRPVICICNDLYAPALRPLRQVAKVHIFVQPTVCRIVSRLKHICSKEGMKTSSIALTTLAEYTECDIRSCLNTLQFLNKKKETLNMTDVGAQVIGRKDISKGVFDIWKEIFQKRKSKPERKSYGNSMPNEMEFLHSLVSNRGDYDIIFDGIHENILHLQYHDPLMQKTVKCFNSLGISDVMQQYVMRTQQMHLYAYQSPIAITVHRLVAQVQKPNIEWPKSYHRYRTSLMENTDTLKSWQTKMPPYISRHLSVKSFVEDTISSFLHILSPPNLKPVALHLLSEKEKLDFSQLVSTMVSYAITYKNIKACLASSKQEQEATLDTLPLSFDPPICDFISFKGYNSGHYVLPVPMKQVLVHEVEKQKILQVSKSVHAIDGCYKENSRPTREKNNEIKSPKIDRVAAFAAGSGNGQKTVNPIQSNPSGSKTSKALDSGAVGSTIVSSNGQGNVKKPSRGSINYFDRFRKAKSKDLQNESNGVEKGTSGGDSRPLLFKFNEGFTNAIKKPVRMREFL